MTANEADVPEMVACLSCGRAVGVPEPRKTRLLNLRAPLAICRCTRCGLSTSSRVYATDPYYAADNAHRGAGTHALLPRAPTPGTIRALLAQEGFDVIAARTHLRAHPSISASPGGAACRAPSTPSAGCAVVVPASR